MPLTTDEMIMNLTEDIETLISYIQLAKDEGFAFPKEIELDLECAERDLEKVYDEDYCDTELV